MNIVETRGVAVVENASEGVGTAGSEARIASIKGWLFRLPDLPSVLPYY